LPALILSTALFLAGVFVVAWLQLRIRLGDPVPVARPDPAAPLISVLVPARNEARNLRRCIECLQTQTHPNWELIVIDDHSTDATADIAAEAAARDPRIRLLRSAPLPPGWVGKSHALVQGAEAARGEWLCLLDADTFASPDLLSSTLAEAREHDADMISILTLQELESFWEKTISPVAFSGCALVYNLDRINDPQQPDAMAIGQYILIRRKVYEETGGHHAFSDSILEDRAIAETVKRAGHRILLKDGRGLARTRMHTSLGEIWESWVKTIYPGMRDKPGMVVLTGTSAMAGAVIFPLWWAASAVWLTAGATPESLLAFFEASLFWVYCLWRRAADTAAFKISRGYACTAPLGVFLFGAMMLDSYFRVLSGRGLTWKGRIYQTK
jgi:chlorobactene glucosyltransferase